jgi:hypothetical protein
MKPIQLIPILLITLTAVFTMTSCTNDDSSDLNQTVIQNNVQKGTWKITSFIDSGNDETNHFNGYVFTFENDGTLNATNGNGNVNGTWNITDSNSTDDSPGDLDFNIHFNLTNDFEDLNEDWHIVSQTSDRIELIHVSGGNGGTDNLIFEKI